MTKNQKKTPQFEVTMIMNGETFTDKGDDLKELITKMKPEFLHNDMYITISKADRLWERKLTLIQGRKLFNDETSLDIFINNLI